MTAAGLQPETERRIAGVRARMAAACARSGRDPGSVRLIAVSKLATIEMMRSAWDAGVRDFGENRVQDAMRKQPEFGERIGAPGERPVWHFIGRLQSNKARRAAALFDAVHSVDDVRIADELAKAPRPSALRVLIEVNVAGEAAKGGVAPQALPDLVQAVRARPELELAGLMTVAPFCADPEAVRPVFRELRALAGAHALRELSMGMTGDFEVAIEEGATLVRVGRAIFGERIG